MTRSIAMVSVACAFFASPALAGVMGPTRPSQAVVLRVSGAGTACVGQGGGQEVDLQVHPDGTVDTYVPPVGQAFVITGIDYGMAGSPANQYTPIVIRLTSPHPPAPLVFATGAMSDGAGNTWGSAIVPNVAVAPGVSMCVGASGLTQVVVHGFHTVYK